MRTTSVFLVTTLALAACATQEGGRGAGGSTNGGATGSTDANPVGATQGGGSTAGTGSTMGSGTGPGDMGAGTGSEPSEGDAAPAPSGSLRFVVLGDGGTGDAAQAKVAAAMKTVCAERGCAFALYLGDNIYEDGANGVTDAQFAAKFETPYADLDFPFYVVLGNHDYGSNGTNLLPSEAKSAAQVEYTARSEKWNMPHYYYAFREGPVAFFGLDTNGIVIDQFRKGSEQQAWLDAEIAKSDAPWKIVFGHHPYISNGEHGVAGSYVGSVGIELHDGARLKSFVEESICGKSQVYFSGHDHDREWLEPTCGTTFIVSGAAAKLRQLEERGVAARFGEATQRGFMWVEIEGDVLTGVFYDDDAEISYEDTILRK